VDLTELEAALESFSAGDMAEYADPESVLRLERLALVMERNLTAAVGQFDVSGAWAPSGAKTPVAWLAKETRLPKPALRRQVGRGRRLGSVPKVASSWAKGSIGPDHFDVLASLAEGRTAEAYGRDEDELLHEAETRSYADFLRRVRYWEQEHDPEGAEESDLERADRRRVYLVQSLGGMFLGQMTLDPLSGAAVHGELSRLADEFYEADWAKAKARLGRDPYPEELERTLQQRWCDALVEMAVRSASAPADARRPAPLYSILIGYETLFGRICELENGRIPIAPGTVLANLDGADLERALFLPGGRVEVGITSRFFTGATRRAIEVRDQVCTHEYCDTDGRKCQADHILEWSKGGLTTQENGRLLCSFHNRLRNQRPPPEE
jgi:hypothetical protein